MAKIRHGAGDVLHESHFHRRSWLDNCDNGLTYDMLRLRARYNSLQIVKAGSGYGGLLHLFFHRESRFPKGRE